jgi:hypothetical protein
MQLKRRAQAVAGAAKSTTRRDSGQKKIDPAGRQQGSRIRPAAQTSYKNGF